MTEEILACIDKSNIKFLQSGQISKYIFPMERKEAHKKKIPHIIVRFFGVTISPENKIFYLIQRRSNNKRSFPEYYTDSASGHVVYKPNLDFNDIKENALRELEEEFGIPSQKVLKVVFHNLDVEDDNYSTEIAYIFFGLLEYGVKLRPHPFEVEAKGSDFYDKNHLNRLLNSEKTVDYAKKIWEKLFTMDIPSIFERYKELCPRSDVALFLGRFQPLHLGHLHVFKEMAKSHKFLKIGIGSAQLSREKNDPFTSEERTQFIFAAMESLGVNLKNFRVFEIPDIFNSQKWVDHVVSIVGPFDIVYSNSEWVRELFSNKDYKIADKILFEEEKFNATNVRKLICENDNRWKELVPQQVVKLIDEFHGVETIKNLNK